MENRFNVLDLIIKLFFIGLLFVWCFILLRPFIEIILWGIILAIAIFPLFLWLKARLGGQGKLSGTILALMGVAVIIGPVSVMATVFVSNVDTFANSLGAGKFSVPPPPEGVATWPFIGQWVNNIWQSASVNLGAVLSRFQPQIEALAKNLIFLAANIGLVLLKFIVSIILAGLLMINAEGLNRRLSQIVLRLTPKQGQGFLQLATATIRGVTRGIIGVAILQSLLIGLGLIVAQIPFAGLLTLLCLILAIVQIGPGLVVFPTIIFAWSTMGTMSALLFTLWMIPTTLVDNILKPILMAQGLPVPTVIILIGVLGGTLAHGILGLFIGPVILSLGYELIMAWVNFESSPVSSVSDGEN
ncbi:AI-2E family transporter [Crocosphaera sp. XPORK-15E]|uniref:AI-2E family transporter n=1 Tax=Crocosphaera sp. XPORK-15E TaxID=3110247 RepID=UPI002B1EFE7E|nr:AI-2E family transporter [Crocosphaera sp. XPORK-15E]MEA5532971.1 AI-2E family transporter [Crocosphaera sp. XPORK-15E]